MEATSYLTAPATTTATNRNIFPYFSIFHPACRGQNPLDTAKVKKSQIIYQQAHVETSTF
ncbi:hypothetical protein [Pontibacter chitinilyticus]|uniref:hypothetical protein n=1 Tax=Pontibacter chitinilyticus TaxID=2674989 RepID=UPI00321C0E64